MLTTFFAYATVLCAANDPVQVAANTEVATTPRRASTVREWLSRVVDFGGVAYLFYKYDATPGANDMNKFDIARLYFSTVVKPIEHLRFRFTFDVPERNVAATSDGKATAGGGSLDVILKHAYIDYHDHLAKGLSLRFGLHSTPWIPFEDALWGYRFQGPALIDREGYMSSADLGVSAKYRLPSRHIEAHFSLVHGEAWKFPENSQHKDLHGRVTVRPFASDAVLGGLSLSLFGSFGQYAHGPSGAASFDRNRFIGMVSFEHRHAFLAAQYLKAQDPAGRMASRQPSLKQVADQSEVVTAEAFSAFGWLDFGLFGFAEGLRLMARFDRFDPDVTIPMNYHSRLIAGVGYRFNKYFQVLVDGELVWYGENAGDTKDTTKPTEKALFVHFGVGF